MHLMQKRRRRIWHMESIILIILFLPFIFSAKFYTGNVSSPSTMKEIFIDDWPETRKAPLSKNLTEIINQINPSDNTASNETLKSLENIG